MVVLGDDPSLSVNHPMGSVCGSEGTIVTMDEDDGDVLHARVAPADGVYEVTLMGIGVTQARVPSVVLAAVLAYIQTRGGVGDVKGVEIDWSAVVDKICCGRMADQVCYTCNDHPDAFDCPDLVVTIMSDGTYGLLIHDGGRSFLEIIRCPWCGSYLPPGREMRISG